MKTGSNPGWIEVKKLMVEVITEARYLPKFHIWM
jgi:hypothetical protein